MAGARLTYIEGADTLQRRVRRLLRQLAHPKPAFAAIGEHLIESHERRIAQGQSPDGTPFAPLSPEYRATKERHADRVLVLDDILRTTLAYQATDKGLEFGSNRIYAATHQFGAPGRGIPARPFLGTSPDDEDEIVAIIGDFLGL